MLPINSKASFKPEDLLSRLGEIALSVAWAAAIASIVERLGVGLTARWRDQWPIGAWAEVLILLAVLPALAFGGGPRPSAVRTTITHGGMFCTLATISVFVMPWSPYSSIGLWKNDESALPVPYGPLVCWTVSCGVVVLVWTLVRKKAAAAQAFGWAASLMICALCWWTTSWFIVGGWLLMRYYWGIEHRAAHAVAWLAYLAALILGRGWWGVRQPPRK